MPEHPFQNWLAKTVNHPSILAGGVHAGTRSIITSSYCKAVTEQQIQEILQRLAEIALGLRVYQLGGSRWRWVFEHGQLQIARRSDGVIAVLAMNEGTDGADAVEELFEEFDTIVCTLAERAGVGLTEGDGTGALRRDTGKN